MKYGKVLFWLTSPYEHPIIVPMNKSTLTPKDVWNIILVFICVGIASLPFIFWSNIENTLIEYPWIRFITFPITAILSIVFIFVIILAKTKNSDVEWYIYALLGFYALITIVTTFLQISYFADNWHWFAWVICMIIWFGLAFLATYIYISQTS
jgi:hypothetical protein